MFADPFLKLFILLLLYVGILFLFRYINVGKKRIINSCNNACPDCNNPTLKMENGCDNCVDPDCGYSKCDK